MTEGVIKAEDKGDKLELLKEKIANMKSVVIGFSGGVDSTFLLRVCRDVLGPDNVLAVTVKSPIRFDSSLARARNLADKLDINHLVIRGRELESEAFKAGAEPRCYLCKQLLYGHLREMAEERGINQVLDGTNYDDLLGGDRPGYTALQELGIETPLKDSGLTKADIRHLSKKLDLPTWKQKSDTCLATRFPLNIKISREMVARVKDIELFLGKYNLKKLRARVHDKNTIRIEVLPEEIPIIAEYREEITAEIKEQGFNYVTLDLEGYRSGSIKEIMEGESNDR